VNEGNDMIEFAGRYERSYVERFGLGMGHLKGVKARRYISVC